MITLKWKPYNISNTKYYYTLYNGKFWCIKASYVSEGVADSDFVFQVTEDKMDEKIKNALVQRLANIFPELDQQQIKNALHFDKNASM